MLVYVINCHGVPLMPCREAKARKLLQEKLQLLKGGCKDWNLSDWRNSSYRLKAVGFLAGYL